MKQNKFFEKGNIFIKILLWAMKPERSNKKTIIVNIIKQWELVKWISKWTFEGKTLLLICKKIISIKLTGKKQ